MPKGHYIHKPRIPNPRPILIPVGPSIAYVELTREKWSVISVDDIQKVSDKCWMYQDNGYAKSRHGYMHRILTGAPKNRVVDHASGEGLHNLPHNMRICTSSQNVCNKRKSKIKSSGLKGVSWDKPRDCWRSDICHNRKRYALGRFATPEAAHYAYCEAAKRLHGEFARM